MIFRLYTYYSKWTTNVQQANIFEMTFNFTIIQNQLALVDVGLQCVRNVTVSSSIFLTDEEFRIVSLLFYSYWPRLQFIIAANSEN